MANLYVTYNSLTMGPLDDPDGECDGGVCAIPTPYVSRTDRWEYLGNKSFRVIDINISGKIYADNDDIINDTEFSTVETRRNAILNAYDEDFHTLYAGNYEFDYVKVNDVNFSQGNVGIIEFSISLTSYGEWFENTGVTDVKNEYSYAQGDDGQIVCRHSMSAKVAGAGYTDDEADPIARAKSICEQFAGYDPTGSDGSASLSSSAAGLAAKFSANDVDGVARKPFSISHTSDRAGGSYSIEETYKQGIYSIAGYTETYNITEKRNIDENLATIQIQYEIKAPPGKDISTIRSHVPTVLGFYNKVNDTDDFGIVYDDSYNEIAGSDNLDGAPISYEINESQDESIIRVSIEFDQLNTQVITNAYDLLDFDDGTKSSAAIIDGRYTFFDYEVTISTDEITELTTVDISGTIKSTGGNLTKRKSRIDSFYCSACSSTTGSGQDMKVFTASLAAREYFMETSASVALVSGSAYWYLNPNPLGYSEARDGKTGEITISASFDNRDMYYLPYSDITNNLPAGFPTRTPANVLQTYFHWQNFSWSVSQKTAMNLLSMKAGMNGNATFHDYLIFDHNTLTKETTTISIQGEEIPWFSIPLSSSFPTNPTGEYKPDYKYVNTKATNVALSLVAELVVDNFLDLPIRNDLIYRGLESYESSRKGVSRGISWGPGYGAGPVSKNYVISQTVGSPFIGQDYGPVKI